MSIQIKRDEKVAPLAREHFDPLRWARELFRWDPFREMGPTYMPAEMAMFAPAFEVKETKDAYVFKADVPGVKEEELEITRTGNRLSIAGKREAEREEKGETYYACERNYGSFVRTFTLPEGIDDMHIAAELKEGVLTLVVPKAPEAQAKKIAIKPAEEKH